MSSNQRDFYRVDCRAVLSYLQIGDGIPPGKLPENFFPDNEHFNLMRELRRLDQEHGNVLHALGEQNRTLHSYLGVINRKIDVLARHLASLTPEMSRGEEQTVSLSEGGLAFSCNAALAIGSVLALRLTLLPAWVGVTAFGVVTKTAPLPDGRTAVTVNFERLQDGDRQAIARQVMQVQMAERKKGGGRP